MYVSTLTISSKGQIVLPKKIRKILGSNIISLIIGDHDQILITPVHELGGSLSSYTRDPHLSFEEVREQAWQQATLSKVDNSSNGEAK